MNFLKKIRKTSGRISQSMAHLSMQKNQYQTDNNTKELIRKKVVRLQQENNVTNYRIYTDLKLNHGNLNAWLKYGYCDKVSLDTARITLKYLENII